MAVAKSKRSITSLADKDKSLVSKRRWLRSILVSVQIVSIGAAGFVQPSVGLAQSLNSASSGVAHGATLSSPNSASAPAVPKRVDVFSFRDPETGEKVQFQYEPSSRETLEKFKPSRIRKEILDGLGPRPGIRGLVKGAVMDFPAEWVGFSMATGLTTEASNDPASVKHFIDQNILDPMAYVSFAGFIAGSRTSTAALRAMGLAHDPHRNAPNYVLSTPVRPGITSFVLNPGTGAVDVVQKPSKPDHFLTRVVKVAGPPTPMQIRFAPLMVPLSIAAGMTVSNVIHEVSADKDIRACSQARSKVGMPVEEVDAICDRAWENWAFTNKAADYTPGILALGSAALIQGYFVNRLIKLGVKKTGDHLAKAMSSISAKSVTTGKERYIPYVFRGFRYATGAGLQHPFGRFVMLVGNFVVLMEIAELITPWFTQPFELVRQSGNFADELKTLRQELDRAEKNQWQWKARVPSWCEPGANLRDSYVMQNRLNYGCPESQIPRPSTILRKHAERQTKWRETLLQEAFEAHKNWQDHVSAFVTRYANATKFYKQTVQHLNYQRFEPQARQIPSQLFTPMPFYGLSFDGQDFSNESKMKAINQARAWLEKYLESAKRLHSTERSVLPQILLGLQAADPELDIRSLAPMQVGLRNFENMTPAQREDFEIRIREAMLERSLKQLRETLLNDPLYSDKFITYGSEVYSKMAAGNPFMKLRLLLGDPEPLGPGVAFIRGSNEDGNIIEQETKMNHPDGIGRAQTNSMAEYLLTSMVCGPEVDPQFSDKDKIRIYTDKNPPKTFEAEVSNLKLGARPQRASDPDVLIAVDEYRRKVTGLETRHLPRWSENSIATEWLKFGISFRPPRIVEGVPPNLCQQLPKGSSKDKVWFDIYQSQWTIGGETYHGIIDLVRKRARPEIVGTSAPPKDKNAPWLDPFDAWWTKHVDAHVDTIVKDLRARYKEILTRIYIPALLGEQQGALASSLRGMNVPFSFVGRDVKMGALDSIKSELEFYTGILLRTTKGDPEIAKAGTNLKSAFQEMGRIVSDLNYVEMKGDKAKAAVEAERLTLMAELDTLNKALEKFESTKSVDAEIKAVNKQALRNIQSLIGELDSYWGLVRGIQVPRH